MSWKHQPKLFSDLEWMSDKDVLEGWKIQTRAFERQMNELENLDLPLDAVSHVHVELEGHALHAEGVLLKMYADEARARGLHRNMR